MSKVRSITLDSWEPELLRVMTELGNARVNEIFEAVVVGDSFTRPIQSSLRSQLVRFLCLVAVPFSGHFFQLDWVSCYQNVSILDFIGAKDDGDNWSYKTCTAPVKSSPLTNQHPVFTGRMPFLSPNQQCQRTEGKSTEGKLLCLVCCFIIILHLCAGVQKFSVSYHHLQTVP